MIRRPTADLSALMQDHALLERAVGRAQAEAARLHRLLGQPLVVWRDGRVEIEQPQSTAGDPADPVVPADGL